MCSTRFKEHLGSIHKGMTTKQHNLQQQNKFETVLGPSLSSELSVGTPRQPAALSQASHKAHAQCALTSTVHPDGSLRPGKCDCHRLASCCYACTALVTVQKFLRVENFEKDAKLFEIIAELPEGHKTLVFANMKRQCESLAKVMIRKSIGATAIHGDKEQWERDRALKVAVPHQKHLPTSPTSLS